MVVIGCGVAAGLGYFLGEQFSSSGARLAALASGGLLAMLTNSLMPFSFERGREWAGVATVIGFFGAMALPQ
jgi:ZIP family zinc transporter